MSEYYSLYRGASAEIEEKKSRFIATIEPACTEEEAADFIARCKKKYYDARHNCTAFIVGDAGEIMRSNDDGEPSGTAGRPMLEVLSGAKVTNIVCVVTRYFGGTLLGTGGLIRAYQGAVKAALDECVIIHKLDGIMLIVTCDYNDSGKITYMAASNKWNVMSTEYGEKVTFTILDETSKIPNIEKQIIDATAAKAQIEQGKQVSYAVLDGEIKVFE